MRPNRPILSRRPSPSRLAVVIATVRRQTLLRGIAQALEVKGVGTAVYLDVDDALSAPAHLVVLGPKDQASLDWALRRQASGTLVIPDPQLTAKVVDRVSCRALVHDAGLRTPKALCGVAANVAKLIGEPVGIKSPFVIKLRREHGKGIATADSIAEVERYLLSVNASTELVIEEKILGRHLTAYALGRRIVVFDRPAFGPAESEIGQLKNVPADIELAIASFRERTGLLFGKLDMVRAADGSLFWVDVGVFPRFENIPEAAGLIGDLLYDRMIESECARRVTR